MIVPDKITVLNDEGKEVSVDTTTWTPEFIAYCVRYAWGVRLQRCTANVEKAKHAATRRECHAAMKRGEIPSGGGGGAQGTPEERAWVEYFKATKTKISGKEAGIRSLPAFWEWGCRQSLVAGGESNPTAADIAEALEAWKRWMEEEDADLRQLITAERVKSGVGQKPKAFSFKKQ